MSGKKQHIIPRFFQENFAINNQIFRFSKNKKIKLSIKDNWAERFYYSDDSNTYMDDKITSLESSHLVNILNNIIEEKVNIEKNITPELAFLIKHFWSRNKFIKETIKFSVLNKINKIDFPSILKNIENLLLEKHSELFKQNPHLIVAISNVLDLAGNDAVEIMSKSIIENNDIHKISIEKSAPLVLKNFKYKVILTDDFFILPDTIISCCSNSLNDFSPFFDNSTSVIFFPISKNKLVLIYKEEPVFDLEEINKYLAISCYDAFCSSFNDLKCDEYRNLIHSSYIYYYDIEFSEADFVSQLFNNIDNTLENLKNKEQL